MANKLATFGGGCFWCTEAVFQRFKGVISVQSGYMGGHKLNPTYKEICTGTTGHAEVVQIKYDPGIISFETLLEIFWTSHDPTTLNRQGNDKGTQYRSVVFYEDEGQKESTLKSIEQVASKLYRDPIVTEVSSVSTFYPAENHHNDYFDRNGYAPYCRIIIAPKVNKTKEKFSHLLKESPLTHEE